MSEKATTRITIDLPQDLDQRLDELATLIGESKADAIRAALRVFEHLAYRSRDGYELLERKDGILTPVKVFSKV